MRKKGPEARGKGPGSRSKGLEDRVQKPGARVRDPDKGQGSKSKETQIGEQGLSGPSQAKVRYS